MALVYNRVLAILFSKGTWNNGIANPGISLSHSSGEAAVNTDTKSVPKGDAVIQVTPAEGGAPPAYSP